MSKSSAKPFVLAEALLEQLSLAIYRGNLAARYYPRDDRGVLTGSHLCATCSKTISANKHQCASCAEMTELIALVLARGIALERSSSLNPEAEARITELRLKHLRDEKLKAKFGYFIYRLVHTVYPAETTMRSVVEFTTRLLVEG